MPTVWRMDLTLRNADYVATQDARVKSRDLFGGTEVVRLKRETYLFREKNETTDDYELRLKRAVLDNYVEKVIKARLAVLFMRPVQRELDARLKAIEVDVDRRGTAAAAFFHSVVRNAEVDGISWVHVDMPLMAPDAKSAADEKQAGMRPFFEEIPAANVIDWEVGPDHALLWAVIEQNAVESREAGAERKSKTQYKVWTRNDWKVYEANAEAKDNKTFTVAAAGPNPLNTVPLVPFYGIKYSDFAGLPVCYSVLAHILLIYNKQSDLDWFERLYCHPIPYVVSPKKPEKLDTGGGFHVESGPQTGEIAVNYLQTTGAGEGGVRDSIDRIEGRIYQTALAQAKRDTKQVQAEGSQREDRKIFTSSLKTDSERSENAERRSWALAAKWLGIGDAKSDIAYSRDFDDRTIDEAMLATFSGMVDEQKLSLETFLKTLEYSDVIPNFVAKDEQKLLETEAKTRAVRLLADTKKAAGGA